MPRTHGGKRKTALPARLQRPQVLESWRLDGCPVLADWVEALQGDEDLFGIELTESMLNNQLLKELTSRGYTIASYRQYAQSLPPDPLPTPAIASPTDPAENPPRFIEGQDEAFAESFGKRIHTLDELLEVCQVDLNVWRVEDYKLNKYEAPVKTEAGLEIGQLIQIKARLVRKPEAKFAQALDALLAKADSRSPSFSHIRPLKAFGEYLFAPQIYDLHVNRLSSDGRYSIEQAENDYIVAFDAMLRRGVALGMPFSRILMVAGHDALHTDGLGGMTTKGTHVETTGDPRDAIVAVCNAYVTTAEQAASVAPVDLRIVQSNHDRYSSYFLGMYLQAYFRNHPNINVVVSREPRQYYQFGRVLLGLEHGDLVKPADLALLMATEAPHLWAATTYREVLRGHLHKAQGMYHPISEEKGVIVRTIPSLANNDEYHLLRGFVGNHRAAEGLIYHAEHGTAGVFPVFINEVKNGY